MHASLVEASARRGPPVRPPADAGPRRLYHAEHPGTPLSLEVGALSDEIDEKIRAIVETQGRLRVDAGSLRDDEDLYRLGMTSHANVNVMLALEEAFEVEFPEEMLRRATFQSLGAIRASVSLLLRERATT